MNREAAATLLNVPVDATGDQVMRAFALRARLTHPDRFAGAPSGDIAAAAAEFVRVTEARDTLLGRIRQTGEPARPEERPSRAASNPMPYERFVQLRESRAWVWPEGETLSA
ncbi:J domain-containing protein [Leifsonia poae]|uniref:J domain-containing protein n=1 Tax=Leifsonia poae TaxID=110933 RepID=UPI003D67CD6D